ncbi:MAG: GNAT family N-acetyltransferase [Pseudomonadota bacterium]|uniref:GNAT family N-acetyltransferase n=1 Tax=Phenylobacterium sp. TaxID=1871053 RepID=UPI0025D84C49|nr:GNAT family N-acetyltransferase [Phenylobacterium sp.]MBT9470658.1 GNAT family N-acetyltransferase [Phenylobacterium sp.]
MIQLVRIIDELPGDFERLRTAAAAEGHRHIERLDEDWNSGAQRFAGDGEALLAAYQGGELVGIGGVTREPSETAEPALRMRRLFVSPQARRTGVARTIVAALAQEGFDNAALITVHAGDPAAGAFWEAQGFQPVTGLAWSHELRR